MNNVDEKYDFPDEKLVCSKCKKEKPSREFYISAHTSKRLRRCKKCTDELSRQKQFNAVYVKGYMKCILCLNRKPIDMFSVRGKVKVIRNKTCKDCISVKNIGVQKSKPQDSSLNEKIWELIRDFNSHGF